MIIYIFFSNLQHRKRKNAENKRVIFFSWKRMRQFRIAEKVGEKNFKTLAI